jgi:hypothetical protein
MRSVLICLVHGPILSSGTSQVDQTLAFHDARSDTCMHGTPVGTQGETHDKHEAAHHTRVVRQANHRHDKPRTSLQKKKRSDTCVNRAVLRRTMTAIDRFPMGRKVPAA